MLSGKKLIILGFIAILLAVIPITVFFLQKQQEIRGRAAPATVLSFEPSTKEVSVGDTFTLNIVLNPGSNQVAAATINLGYDSSILQLVGNIEKIDPSGLQQGFTSVLDSKSSSGNAEIVLAVGTDATKIITVETIVAKVTFKALKTTETPTKIIFKTQATGGTTTITGFDVETNVLANTQDALITVKGDSQTTPTPTTSLLNPTSTPFPTSPSSITTMPTPTTAPVSTNKAPICTALNLDREATGEAPYALTFTAVGSDPDSTINKVTFNFGDGPVQDVLQGGGIGTNTVSSQVSHTYKNPGRFTVSAVMTDDKNAVSSINAECTKVITVNQTGASAQTSGKNDTIVVPTMAPSGPDNKIMGLVGAGVILSIIGALLFFAL